MKKNSVRKPRNPRHRVFLALPLGALEDAAKEGITIVAHDATAAAKQHRELVGAAEAKSVLVEILAVISSSEQKRLVLKAETWGE